MTDALTEVQLNPPPGNPVLSRPVVPSQRTRVAQHATPPAASRELTGASPCDGQRAPTVAWDAHGTGRPRGKPIRPRTLSAGAGPDRLEGSGRCSRVTACSRL